MMHIYRDAGVRHSRLWAAFVVGLVLLLVLWPLAFGWRPSPTWDEVAPFLGFVGVVLVVQFFVYRREQYRTCREIRLGDDRTCELETKRRLIRLHVSEIRSVEYSRDSETGSETYTIRYQGGKLHVGERMTDFAGFLTRLKALNPAVDLTSFPAEIWPGLGGRAAEPSGPLRSFVQRLLFPLIVIVLFVSLASHTLLGK